MRIKKISELLIMLLIIVIVSKYSFGACGDGICGCSSSVGFSSGTLYSNMYVCHEGGTCDRINPSTSLPADGTADFDTGALSINWMDWCTTEGWYDIKYVVDNEEPNPPNYADDGTCTISDAKEINYDKYAEFCIPTCIGRGGNVEYSHGMCCGDDDGDCGVESGRDICMGDWVGSYWGWYSANLYDAGDVISHSCGAITNALSDGAEWYECGSGEMFTKASATSEVGVTHEYLCLDLMGHPIRECVGNSVPLGSGTDTSPLGHSITERGTTYYCLMATPTGSNTVWSTTAPECDNFCGGWQAEDCCTQAGTISYYPWPYSIGNTCYYSGECNCVGWTTVQQTVDSIVCTTAGTDNGTHCFMTTTSRACDYGGWGGCPELVEGGDIDSTKASCPGSEDVAGVKGYIDGDLCYYTTQSDSCSATLGWTCSPGSSQLKAEIPSVIGGGTTCRYALDTSVASNGCLEGAGGGWKYLDDPGKQTCYSTGQTSPDNTQCFTSPKIENWCEPDFGWKCTNGSYDDNKEAVCAYHTGTCSQSGGKWNPECYLHYNCVEEKCDPLGDGWVCYGGVNPNPKDSGCEAIQCRDCNMDGTCDNTQLSGNDNDGDGILNVCEPDETPEQSPAPEDPDYSDPDDECADGYDNDDDGTCDYYGCFCQASNNYCGKGSGWSGTNMPADPDCMATCNPCSECGYGFFNICDLDECTSCLPSGDCSFHDVVIDFCCLDEDHDTFCEDTQSPIDKCPGEDDRIDIDQDRANNDDDIRRDCLDEYLICKLDSQCKSYGWGDETCDCPDCNLSAFPCQAWPGTVCIQKGDRSTWECMDWDDNAYNCEMHLLAAEQGNCDTNGEVSCWDEPYMGVTNAARCCGDDGVDDTWQNPDTSGCSRGTFFTDPDSDDSGVLCNFEEGVGFGIDCEDGNLQPSCWYLEPDPACCGDDPLEYQTYSNGNIACCPRDNDYAEAGGICIPQSTYLHPTETAAADTTDLGSEVGSLTDSELYPYNQTVTLVRAYGDFSGDPLFEIEGQFSALDRPDSIPPSNIGFVDLSGLRITDDGASIYVNATWLMASRPSNRISDEYMVYVPNINDGIGLTVCTDPQYTERNYGEECSQQTTFTRPATLNDFKLEITEDYYKITTSLEEKYDWYVFVHVQPDLKIESDAELMTKRSFENVGFYAEMKSGGASIPDAACKIFYHDGLNVTMEYNDTSGKYYHERTYKGKGLYEWEVRCSHPFYLPISSSKMASIKPNSELIIYDITDSKTRMINETVDFFAFYRDLPGQNLVEAASCNITYHEETSEMMTLDEDENGEKYFSEDREYLNYGTFSYMVKCAKEGYDTMTAVDVVEIFPTTCEVTRIGDEALIAGKSSFNVISKRGFVLLKKKE